SRGGGQPGMVALGSSGGDQRVSTVGDRTAYGPFEFAYLVAATTKSGEVVTLDPQIVDADADGRCQPGCLLDGCGPHAEGDVSSRFWRGGVHECTSVEGRHLPKDRQALRNRRSASAHGSRRAEAVAAMLASARSRGRGILTISGVGNIGHEVTACSPARS